MFVHFIACKIDTYCSSVVFGGAKRIAKRIRGNPRYSQYNAHCERCVYHKLLRMAVETTDYCLAEVFEAECAEREVIMIRQARYGRMRIGRCVRTDFGFVGCYADVLDIVAMRCSGRRRCSLRVPDPLFEKTTGCNAEFKSYFEVSYSCVPGRHV